MDHGDPPLRRSKRELTAARAAVQAMRDATSFEAFAIAWQTFLDRLEKVWVKAERECQTFRTKFEPWQGTFKVLRKDDPLLRYLHQARHADQHSIQPTAAERLAGITLEIPPKGTVELRMDEEKGQVIIVGPHRITSRQGPGNMLLPLENRGTKYDPPEEHLGRKLTAADPLAVAEVGLAFYEDFVRQAEAKFFPGKPVSASVTADRERPQ
jgi:hypothetical protein